MLAVVGITVLDVIFPRVPRLPAWPRHGEFTAANLVRLRNAPIFTLGGNGANAAYVASRCGARVTLHTQLGSDLPGDIARQWLESAGCEVRASSSGVSTALNVTAADAGQRRATFFYGGDRPVLPRFPASSPAPRQLLVCGWPHPPLASIGATFRAARRRGTFTALDVGPILGRPWTFAALRPVLAALDLLLANVHELQTLTRTTSVKLAMTQLRRVFDGHVVIKRGPDGASWAPAGSTEIQHVRSRRVRVVNTIGAGDTFNGTLLAALGAGVSFLPALRSATAVAASVVASGRGVLGVRLSRRVSH